MKISDKIRVKTYFSDSYYGNTNNYGVRHSRRVYPKSLPDGRLNTKRNSSITVIDGRKTKEAIGNWTRGILHKLATDG